MLEANVLADVSNVIGESPVWLAATQTVYWVDAERAEVYWRAEEHGVVGSRSLALPVTALIPTTNGGWILVTKDGLHSASQDFTSGAPLIDPTAHDPRTRLNDGVADRWGRVWTGSQSDQTPTDPIGRLYVVASASDVTAVDEGFAVTNGIAMSPDGATVYVSDMFHRRIRVYGLDPETGAIIGHLPPITTRGPGYPDGLTVDEAGRIWVGYWEGSRVDCMDAKGTIITSVGVAVGHATRACLGGPDGSQLFVTSARYGLDDAQLGALPSSGALFTATVDGVGIPPAEARL